jgi:predicted outer membrane repeat protein
MNYPCSPARVAAALIAAFFSLGGAVPEAAAATLNVTNVNDSGPGSLRQAIATAAAGDTIVFSLPNPSTIKLLTGQLVIARDLTLSGPGASRLTISGNKANRVFRISQFVTAHLSGLTIGDGSMIDPYPGGGIYCDNSTLYLDECAVTKSKAARGGGLALNFSTVFATDCTFAGNTASISGGAIFCDQSSALLSGCALYGNGAASFGGGIHNSNGTVDLTNCTLAQNTSASGGAIYNFFGTIFSRNSTVAQNSATARTGGILNAKGATSYLYNTILATNTAPLLPDIGGDAGTQQDASGGCLIGNGTGIQIDRTGANQIGTAAAPLDPRLGAIQDNGGPTWTMALLKGSPAYNAGDNTLAVNAQTSEPLAKDQRGFTRIAYGRVDSGAFEALSPCSYKVETLLVLPSTPTGDAAADASLQSARAWIRQSVWPSYWEDPFHLTSQGSSVFAAESQAASALTKIVSGNGVSAKIAQLALAALALADQGLAQTAIDEAAASTTCDKTKLSTARGYLAQAETMRANARITEAIGAYGNAWKYARLSCGLPTTK